MVINGTHESTSISEVECLNPIISLIWSHPISTLSPWVSHSHSSIRASLLESESSQLQQPFLLLFIQQVVIKPTLHEDDTQILSPWRGQCGGGYRTVKWPLWNSVTCLCGGCSGCTEEEHLTEPWGIRECSLKGGSFGKRVWKTKRSWGGSVPGRGNIWGEDLTKNLWPAVKRKEVGRIVCVASVGLGQKIKHVQK